MPYVVRAGLLSDLLAYVQRRSYIWPLNFLSEFVSQLFEP
jgi:hypothetical protein